MTRPPRHEWSRPGAGPSTGAEGRFPGGGGGPAAGGRGRGGGFLALARAWAAGIVVLVVTEYLQVTLLYENLAGPSGPRTWGATLALVHLPNLACIALATWAAARTHPEPGCEEPARHAVAACAVPAVAQVLTLAVERHRPGFDGLAVGMSTGVLITGCAVGWAADRWQRSEP
ncbi:hypothetical protein [Streptomyces sp. TS71-3]|uniref:hypothetical protein n=1 Tax=Streptomyces sp. TS71-3 TaxID=2733862 RepID=UPI001B0D2DAF|nr:hypothetical protein [Streptomyces sp. TS71-3]GHJ35341.1 hypothetical protein Sm713_09500 [Streptomyces sp. TS71-3]